MAYHIKLWIYWGLLTIFGLFAVYSTSIWKSFDQTMKIDIIQNIETVKAFNTFLDDTILKTTANIIERNLDQISPTPSSVPIIWEEGEFSGEVPALPLTASQTLPQLSTLEHDGTTPIKLVSEEKKTIKIRNNYKYFTNQVRSLIISLIITIIFLFIPLNWIKNKKLIWTILIGVTIFQLLVFVPWLEAKYGTARGWVDIPGLPNMQPSEFFKVWYIIFMAYWINKKKEIIDKPEFLTQFAVINAIIFLVLLCIPDFWTIFILALSATIMSRYHGLSLKKIGILAWVAMLVMAIGSVIIGLVSSKYRYALVRLTTFVTTDTEQKQYQEKNEGRQIKQGLIAVGGGGLFGQGYGKGLQKMGYLPEAHSDMIFDAFSEEIGFVGNLVLLGLYIGLFSTFLKGIQEIKDPYFKLIGIGLVSLLTIQVFVHIGVNLGILPNTGLTLPFVSHGGTALMINFIELALMYKILIQR